MIKKKARISKYNHKYSYLNRRSDLKLNSKNRAREARCKRLKKIENVII